MSHSGRRSRGSVETNGDQSSTPRSSAHVIGTDVGDARAGLASASIARVVGGTETPSLDPPLTAFASHSPFPGVAVTFIG